MRILAIRFSALGDVAMTIPVILEVLEQNPDAKIDVLTRPFTAKLFPEHPRMNVIPADVDNKYKGFPGLRKLAAECKGYDAVADLHAVLRSRILKLFLKGRKATLDKGREGKKALTRKENKNRKTLRSMPERYADVFRELGLKVELPTSSFKGDPNGPIGFAPFAQHRGKEWPIKHALTLLEELNAQEKNVVLFGGPHEADKLQALASGLDHVKVNPAKGLKQDIEAMRSLSLMISMDSANMHMASLAHLPVVSIWGATHPDAGFLGFGQSISNVVQVPVEELSCRPCSVFGNKPCHRGDWACMERLDASMVLHKISEVSVKQ